MLPFFNKYPYTNFEQLNLDWMMNMIGSFDARITKNTEDIHALDIRVTVAEGDIDDLQERMTTAESDIDDLQDRMTTAEGDIDDLQERMTTAEGKIETLETVVGDNTGGLVKDVDDLQNVVGDEYGGLVKDVDDLQNVVGDDDSGLVKDVNDLESSVSGIPVVVANPAGTPTGSLVTLGIDDDIYTISGGGGGSGTEVIANPSGTPAADLETVSIAGIIYDIPTTDITALSARVTDLETTVGDSSSGLVKDVDDLETVVGDSSSGLVKDVDDLENVVGDLETVVGDSSSGLVHDVNDHETRITNLETTVGDSSSGLVKDVNDLKHINDFYNDVSEYTKTAVDCSHGSPATLDTLTLAAGTWLVICSGYFERGSSTGQTGIMSVLRGSGLSPYGSVDDFVAPYDTSTAPNQTFFEFTNILELNASTTLTLYGETTETYFGVKAKGSIKAIRLKNA